MDLLLLLIPLAFPLIFLGGYIKTKRRRPPPGPRSLPFIGALLEYPKDHQWLTYMQWSREYDSDIIYFTLLGQPILVLNSLEATNDLLEGRSVIYSDRVHRRMIDLMGWYKNVGMLGYDNLWKQHRRLFQQYFNSPAMQQYHVRISWESKVMLQQILETPDRFMGHVQRMAGAVIVKVAYGIEVKLQDDPRIIAAEKALSSLAAIGSATAFFVECFPWLLHLPAWFPGAQFKRDIERWREDINLMYDIPFQMVKDGVTESETSIAASMLAELEGQQDNTEAERLIHDITGSAYVGGADTSVSQIWSFVLAMLLFPGVQTTAQAEIDGVIGRDRLPELADRESLPYITAIMRETFRWRPVVPLAVPHGLLVDDEYRGYHIPAGTTVIGNVWAITHDEKTFPNPETFDPTRHLSADGQLLQKDSSDTIFGFGRRVCPGRHFGSDTVWIAIAHMLAVFDIQKAVGEDGEVLEPSGEYMPGLVMHPAPFSAAFRPRFEGAQTLVQSSCLYE